MIEVVLEMILVGYTVSLNAWTIDETFPSYFIALRAYLICNEALGRPRVNNTLKRP